MSSKEFEVNLEFSQTCLWLEHLAEDTESLEELRELIRTCREEQEWFQTDSLTLSYGWSYDERNTRQRQPIAKTRTA
jgi:hypothetical protein